ncbi:MAG: hypothetical protein ACYSXF_01580 [Planctomycetota bacterium]|jgi:hypothetical protein
MTGNAYLILAYTVGLGLLGGYAITLWLSSRALRKREQRER